MALAQRNSPLLLDYRADRAATLNAQGIRLLDAAGDHHLFVPVTTDPHDLAQADLVLVLVKAYRTEEVAATLAEHLSPTTPVVTLQNGLGNVETLQLYLGQHRIFGGTTAQAALLVHPGVVRDTGSGPTILGHTGGQADPRLDDICQALQLAGFSVSITCDLQAALWNKVLLNAAVNPVGTLTRLRNGALAAHGPSLTLMVAAIRESFAVARAHGIALEETDWRARLQAVCQATAPNMNSMLQDVLHHRRTEIDAINGAIARIAGEHHLPAPINRTLCALVSTLEQGYTEAVER
jgi:2-dehydropantoate 2-reductase